MGLNIRIFDFLDIDGGEGAPRGMTRRCVTKKEKEIRGTLEKEKYEFTKRSNGDLKKNSEKKQAVNAIFARAISAIRPVESQKVKTLQEHDSSSKRSASPIISSSK